MKKVSFVTVAFIMNIFLFSPAPGMLKKQKQYNDLQQALEQPTGEKLIRLFRSLQKPEDRFELLKSCRYEFDMTILHKAVKRGNATMLNTLLDGLSEENQGALLSMQVVGGNQAGRAPLHIAVKKRKVALVQRLLRGLSEPYRYQLLVQQAGLKYTPLHEALSFSDNKEIIAALFAGLGKQAIAQLLALRDIAQRTPLHMAIIKGNRATFEALLEPLALSIETVRQAQGLLDLLNMKDSDGKTVVALAQERNKDGVVQYLNTVRERAEKVLLRQQQNGFMLLQEKERIRDLLFVYE